MQMQLLNQVDGLFMYVLAFCFCFLFFCFSVTAKEVTNDTIQKLTADNEKSQSEKGAGATFDLTFFDNSKVIDFDD
jgi:hypothetical protein